MAVSDSSTKSSKVTHWTRRILRKKDGKGTVTDTEDGKDVKATKLMEFIEASEPKQAKIGVKIHRLEP